MFALQHIYKSYRDKPVLDGINLAVNAGEVVALIGENGAGKTTLLKVILGDLEPDSGNVLLQHEIVSYVPQEASSTGTILDSFGNQSQDWKIDYALSVVGLNNVSKTRAIASLSGGQKTRLAFAKVLAADSEPTMLLLDEPTNNLDTEGLVWLEQFVRNFSGGVVLVSHDRSFINQVATGVVELHNGNVKHYGGDYDFYKQQKDIEYQTQLARYESNLEERKRLEQAIKAQSDKSQNKHKHMKRPDNDKAQRDYFKNRLTVKFGRTQKCYKDALSSWKRPRNQSFAKIMPLSSLVTAIQPSVYSIAIIFLKNTAAMCWLTPISPYRVMSGY